MKTPRRTPVETARAVLQTLSTKPSKTDIALQQMKDKIIEQWKKRRDHEFYVIIAQ